MTQYSSIFWFQNDLRITDNPALKHTADSGSVLPVFIYDDVNCGDHGNGGASNWWLHHSLMSLSKSLDENLIVLRGDPKELIPSLANQYGVNQVAWGRSYEPWQKDRNQKIKRHLSDLAIDTYETNGTLLWEPKQVCKQDGTPYRVFTPFYRRGCLSALPPRFPLSSPATFSFLKVAKEHEAMKGNSGISKLNLLPQISWYSGIEQRWNPGEHAAKSQLANFVQEAAKYYKSQRDFPSISGTSKLSPYLHFGEISINQVWYAIQDIAPGHAMDNSELDCYLSELGWREFSYYLLHHFPDLPHKNYQPKFDQFPWREDQASLQKWQQGQTGIPIVDAGMRELWQTGYMHNRVRMIVASFLIKNLMIHWQEGAKWFWDCLVDADLASNSASWQWVAGSGADAAPYFRIFNPVTQGERFDKDGLYVKTYCPELAKLPNKYIHKPWATPKQILQDCNVELGSSYPEPIVDLATSRKRALDAFSNIK